MIRSFLFVPGDDVRKLSKAVASPADAVIVDLEDSVSPERKACAREQAGQCLSSHPGRELWVRINPLDTVDALADLRAVMSCAPAGIVLPKPRSAKDAVRLATLLDVLEQEQEVPAGRTRILPIATEHPAAVFGLHEYSVTTARLAGLTWGAEDLGTAVGALATCDDQGEWLAPYALARSLCLFAAAAAGVPAIDTVHTDFRDEKGLRSRAANARRDGFTGMLAIHPEQVPVINELFTPSAGEIEQACRIVERFADNPGAGVIGMDGKMLDRPHLLRAQRMLELQRRLTKD